ncbi:MAG: hypothetical protein KKD12_03195, partial [Proteobacteria bacterium]|nr:hypothetical protein [Pseudomonadota bacterium]
MKDKSNDIYEQLADALGSLPNGFTRTQSNTEIQLLKKIFSLEEASIASRLSGRMESVDTIAERFRLPEGEMRSQLMKMVKRGLVWFEKKQRSHVHFRQHIPGTGMTKTISQLSPKKILIRS